MSWKATGQPTVRKHRDKWTVRIEGIDTETGNRRPRQIGTYASQHTALAAAREFRSNERSNERGIMSRPTGVQQVLNSAIYQGFVRSPVSPVMACVAVCQRISGWNLGWKRHRAQVLQPTT
jgi:hypothetical protein